MTIKPFIMPSGKPAPGGQGTDPDHVNHPLHATVTALGYRYSHSTPIHRLDGSVGIHHTYNYIGAILGHNVGVNSDSLVWATSTGTASARSWQGKGEAELRAHLKSKRRRYGLTW